MRRPTGCQGCCPVGALTLPGCHSYMCTCWLLLRQCLCPSLEGVGNLNNNHNDNNDKAWDLQGQRYMKAKEKVVSYVPS